MSDLSEQKLLAEIRLLEEERRAVVFRKRYDIFKGVAVALSAISVFWLIQQPESIINRETSKEAVARERVELILDCLKEQDPVRRQQALAVVHAIYGKSDNEWLENVEVALRGQAAADAELKAISRSLRSIEDQGLRQLYEEKRMLTQELSSAYEDMIREVEGSAGTRLPGKGPVFREKEMRVSDLKRRLDELEYKIYKYEERAGTTTD